MTAIRYKITPISPAAHYFLVRCEVAEPDPKGQTFFLPTWIPGSYKIREFAKYIVTFRAYNQGKLIDSYKIAKHTWRCAPCQGNLMVEYEVYANDPSIRSALLDITRGFINNSSLCLFPEGFENHACELELVAPTEPVVGVWHVATALKPIAIDERGFGQYYADHYEELIDSPIEISAFEKISFTVRDIPHEIVLTEVEEADLARIAHDVEKMCAYWIDFFGLPCPFSKYLFLVKLMAHGYGGLEHRSSSALQFNRYDLPTRHQAADEKYRDFLGLCSHEYFHTWHVKRIRPRVFTPYDLRAESYTRTLWVFEGLTAYYQDLALVRTNLMSAQQYLDVLAQSISRVLRTPGRKKQTLEESSFDAWIKFYDPNENSPNANISYYQKGALVGLLLDLALRTRTEDRICLDDIMRALWTHYGAADSRGMPEYGFEEVVREKVGSLVDDILKYVSTTDELSFTTAFASVGIGYRLRAKKFDQDFGGAINEQNAAPARLSANLGVSLVAGETEAKIAYVYEGGAAQKVGLSPGDMIVAVNGWKVSRNDLSDRIARYEIGEEITVHAFHRDRLLAFPVLLEPLETNICELVILANPDPVALKRRNEWLGGNGK